MNLIGAMVRIKEALYEIITNSAVRAVIEFVIGLSATVVGILLFFKQLKQKLNLGQLSLNKANKETIEKLSQINEETNLKVDNLNNEINTVAKALTTTNTQINTLLTTIIEQNNEIKAQSKHIEQLEKEVMKSRKSDKQIESLQQVLALLTLRNKSFVKDGTASKVFSMLGIKNINENIQAEIEAIDVTTLAGE